jgi:hypothetical protein
MSTEAYDMTAWIVPGVLFLGEAKNPFYWWHELVISVDRKSRKITLLGMSNEGNYIEKINMDSLLGTFNYITHTSEPAEHGR